ncbi:MAG: hypothetical protein Q9168_005945 [Polycauliona sp. 1 TL-2023]
MPSSLRVITLFTAFALSNAFPFSSHSPFQIFKRQQPTTPVTFGKTTCGTYDKSLSNLNLPAGQLQLQVDVQTDCDYVINAICIWVNATTAAATTTEKLNYTTTKNKCEGHFYWAAGAIQHLPDYNECVYDFQQITENCMLGNDPMNNRTQYGVRNVQYIPSDPRDPSMFSWGQIDTDDTDKGLPGYLMGAKGYFGDPARWLDRGYELPLCNDGNVRQPDVMCAEGGPGKQPG